MLQKLSLPIPNPPSIKNRYTKSQLSSYQNPPFLSSNPTNHHIPIPSSSISSMLITKSQPKISININQARKQRIIQQRQKQRRSYSFVQRKKQKERSYSIDQSIGMPSGKKRKDGGQDGQLLNSNTIKQKNLKDKIFLQFITQCYHIQSQYLENLQKNNLPSAFLNLAVLLNYSVDISNQLFFFKLLYSMCQFHLLSPSPQNAKRSLKLFIALQQLSLLRKNYIYLIISFIGIAKCIGSASGSGGDPMVRESILILKKGLEYAWYIGNLELELNIYDQLGERYYRMGEIEKAESYHRKYSDCRGENQESPLRVLSRNQIEFGEKINLGCAYEAFSPILLANLGIYVTNCEELPAFEGLRTPREKLSLKTLNMHNQPPQVSFQIKKLLKTWVFQSETEEPNIQNKDKRQQANSTAHKNRAKAYFNFQFNHHLKMKGINIMNKSFVSNQPNKQLAKRKQSLQQKIKRFVEQPSLQKQWYQKMKKRVQYDQKRKDSHVNDPVIVSKRHSINKNKHQKLKSLFRQIISFINSQQIQPSISLKLHHRK